MITASQKRNVIPALTEVTVDCRLLPGQTQAGVEPMLRAWLGEGAEYRPQSEGDLGARMEAAFGGAFAEGYRRVLVLPVSSRLSASSRSARSARAGCASPAKRRKKSAR